MRTNHHWEDFMFDLAVMRLGTALLLASALPAFAAPPAADDTPVYEMRIYTCQPGKLAALEHRFREHTLRIFARHGMENVAYWVPVDGPRAGTTLMYLLRHASRAAAAESWQAFRNDPEWQQVAARSREEHGQILARGPESTYLAPTDYSPQPGPARQDRLYELRIYTAAPGKLDALHDRFRQHTDAILRKHGMRPVGYFRPLDEPESQNVMIYILEHQDAEAAAQAWRAFGQDPQWQDARDASEADGRLLAERPERTYLRATDYSPRN
jgi:hypothetical protein